MKRIIFVCTGNTCRSPLAEAMAYRYFQDENISVEVLSRGISVMSPSPANGHTRDIVKQDYPAIANHVATAFCEHEVEEETMVLTMTDNHKQYLHRLYPHLVSQIKTYREYLGEAGDIHDPYGGSKAIYDRCAKEIRDLTLLLVEKINKNSYNMEEL